jgi:hypothetical protein
MAGKFSVLRQFLMGASISERLRTLSGRALLSLA